MLLLLTKDTISKIDLKNILIEVVASLQSTGVTVMVTICDQGPTNVSAINELRYS